MHRVQFSSLQRTVAAGGEPKTRPSPYMADMLLTIAKEAASGAWCLVMYRWGSLVQLSSFRDLF